MTRMVFCVLLLAGISGCSSLSNALNNGIKNVDCTAVYTSRLGAGAEKRTAVININKIRIDKNGDYWVKPVNTLNIHFYPGWKSTEHFGDYQCKGENYGLRSAIIRREG